MPSRGKLSCQFSTYSTGHKNIGRGERLTTAQNHRFCLGGGALAACCCWRRRRRRRDDATRRWLYLLHISRSRSPGSSGYSLLRSSTSSRPPPQRRGGFTRNRQSRRMMWTLVTTVTSLLFRSISGLNYWAKLSTQCSVPACVRRIFGNGKCHSLNDVGNSKYRGRWGPSVTLHYLWQWGVWMPKGPIYLESLRLPVSQVLLPLLRMRAFLIGNVRGGMVAQRDAP